MKKYKYISIEQTDTDQIFGTLSVYTIINNRGKDQLGTIAYYPPWKQYVASFNQHAVFNNSCLRDILDFMENEVQG